MELGLAGKVAIVTGGSRGLGRAVCRALAAEGVNVAVNCRQNMRQAVELADEIQAAHGVSAMPVRADVSKTTEVRQMFDQVEATLGQIDIVVNSAGIWPTAFVQHMDEEDWSRTIAVNLTGPFLTCREAVRRWLAAEHAGSIVNIASQAAFQGSTTGHAHYAASKAGQVAFTVSLAREVAGRGIRVNAVAPGMMATEMSREALERDRQEYLNRIPLGRIADPAEVAAVAVFLASERTSYMTGATVDVTGGMLMR